MSIHIENITKHFGAFTALADIDLSIPTGELVALLGPSGCGKTTLLRIIAGLEPPDAGRIRFHGEDATDRHVRDRGVGFVFQHYALFRHMSVFDNIAFGLTVRPRRERPPRQRIRERVRELLSLVQLESLAERYPDQLSGGQRQRVALARALAVEPRVLLLDEPFGALDANVRKDLRRWLRRLHEELHVTSVFVTHDQEEAMEVANRIVVMNGGRVEQEGDPASIYERPATAFVSRFIGSVNRFEGTLEAGHARVGDSRLPVADHHGNRPGDGVIADIRPHELRLSRDHDAAALSRGVIEHIRPRGGVIHVEVREDGHRRPIEVELPREDFERTPFSPGETVSVRALQARIFEGARERQ